MQNVLDSRSGQPPDTPAQLAPIDGPQLRHVDDTGSGKSNFFTVKEHVARHGPEPEIRSDRRDYGS